MLPAALSAAFSFPGISAEFVHLLVHYHQLTVGHHCDGCVALPAQALHDILIVEDQLSGASVV